MKDRRVLLFLVTLAAFMVWMGALIYLFLVLKIADQLDKLQIAATFLGVGAVSQFFMLLLKDSWQFFFRKFGPAPPPTK